MSHQIRPATSAQTEDCGESDQLLVMPVMWVRAAGLDMGGGAMTASLSSFVVFYLPTAN